MSTSHDRSRWRYALCVLYGVLPALLVLAVEHRDVLAKLVRRSQIADQAVLNRVIELDERRLTALEHETSELLYAIHQPVQTIEVRLPEQAILDTAMGIDPLLSGVFGGKVGFHVGLRVEGRPDVTLLRETHDLSSPVEEAARWHPVSIDLGRWADETVELVFSKSFFETSSQEARSVFDLSPTDLMYWRVPRTRPASPSVAKNLVLISIDTLRADHLHFMGYRRQTSPALDALANEGVVFTRCFSQAPWTTPSHFSILTGTHPSSHGADEPIQDKTRWWNGEMPTLASLLRDQGLVTAAFTGRGAISAELGFSKGFDFYNETESDREGNDVERVVDKTVRWLDTNGDRRFFLFVHTYEPHEPYAGGDVPGEVEATGDDELDRMVELYDGDIRRADDHIGRLLDRLARLPAASETLIVVTSDHGEELGEGAARGTKRINHGHTLFDEALHVPLIFHGFGERGIVEGQVRSIDILPTVLDYLDVDPPPGVEGVSLRSRVAGGDEPGLPVASEATTYGTERRSLRTDRYKYVERFSYGQLAQPVSWGLPLTPLHELYDLDQDPGEITDLASDHPEVVRDLSEVLYRMLALGEAPEGRDPESERSRSGELTDVLRSLGYLE